MRLKNIIWKTVVMSLMASPLCISCDDDDEVTVNSKFYLSRFFVKFGGTSSIVNK